MWIKLHSLGRDGSIEPILLYMNTVSKFFSLESLSDEAIKQNPHFHEKNAQSFIYENRYEEGIVVFLESIDEIQELIRKERTNQWAH